MDWSIAIPAFLITLREGVEAVLVVGIVLACLRQAKQPRLIASVWWGVCAGLLASAGLGGMLMQILQQVQQATSPNIVVIRQLLSTGLGILAIAMLSWMLIWMTQQSRSLKTQIETSVQSSLTDNRGAAWGIFSLICTAVLREGVETVLFLSTQVQQGWIPVSGAVLGLVGAVLVGILLFKWGIRINLKRFFKIMGLLLLLIIAGLVVGALRHLDAAATAFVQLHPTASTLCWSASPSCLLGVRVWDAHTVLPDHQFPGIILKTLFGYTQTLYEVQAIAYLAFLGIVGGLYFRSLTPPRPLSLSEPERAVQ